MFSIYSKLKKCVIVNELYKNLETCRVEIYRLEPVRCK